MPTLLAFAVGMRVRDRLDRATFRVVIRALLALSVVSLVVQDVRGLGGLS